MGKNEMGLIWEFYTDKKGEHRWRASDVSNGNILFIAAEGYVDIRDAQKCAERAGYPKEKSE